MIECNQDTIARSLNAIWGWTSPAPPLPFAFYPIGQQYVTGKLTLGANAATEGIMPQTAWTVQNAMFNRESHAGGESTACREAAQSNKDAR